MISVFVGTYNFCRKLDTLKSDFGDGGRTGAELGGIAISLVDLTATPDINCYLFD